MRPSQDGDALSRQGHKGGPVSGAPVPGVVNVHQGITPGGSPQVLSVKALRNNETKKKKNRKAVKYLQSLLITNGTCTGLPKIDMVRLQVSKY